ncbi:Probable protein phosphatase 2C 80 [Linum perenne]
MRFGVLSKFSFGIRQLAVIPRNSACFSPTFTASFPLASSRVTMAASGSTTVFGDVYTDASCGGNGGMDLFKPSGVFFTDSSRVSCCLKASVKMGKKEFPSSSRLVCGNFLFRRKNLGGVRQPLLKHLHTSIGPVPDLSFDDANAIDEQEVVSSMKLNLQSGSCYLPHPEKEATGGEDAHFICVDEKAIGVADGVGGWADVGVNAGLYAQELMRNSVMAIRDESKRSVDPAMVLEIAHLNTKSRGSSTACIIVLTNEGLLAINLGDSGFIVIRDGSTVFRSPVQQHGFNFPCQLASGDGGDLPSAGQVFKVPVVAGDVVITGTDGLFDNLYSNEITAIVVSSLRTNLGPQETAQKIVALARERAMDRNRPSPFSVAAQDAGYRYYGGKLDDITVVVSYVTNSM